MAIAENLNAYLLPNFLPTSISRKDPSDNIKMFNFALDAVFEVFKSPDKPNNVLAAIIMKTDGCLKLIDRGITISKEDAWDIVQLIKQMMQ